jgi:hypothetical protein
MAPSWPRPSLRSRCWRSPGDWCFRAGGVLQLPSRAPGGKAYGQSPLPGRSAVVLTAPGARCGGASPAGRQHGPDVGTRRRAGWRWLHSPMGVFAVAFPGFVFGYFATTNGSLESGVAVYREAGLWMVGGALVFGLLVAAFRVSPTARPRGCVGRVYTGTPPPPRSAYGGGPGRCPPGRSRCWYVGGTAPGGRDRRRGSGFAAGAVGPARSGARWLRLGCWGVMFLQRSKHVYAEQFRVNVGAPAMLWPLFFARPLVASGDVLSTIAPPFP